MRCGLRVSVCGFVPHRTCHDVGSPTHDHAPPTLRGCAAVALPTVASREPVSRCCTVRNCRTPSAPTVRLYNPSTYTSRSQTDADRRSHELLRQHHSLFTIASSSPPFLARPSLSPTHRHFLSLPLLVTAASRRRCRAPLLRRHRGCCCGEPIAGKQSHADCAAARRGLGKAALHFGIGVPRHSFGWRTTK